MLRELLALWTQRFGPKGKNTRHTRKLFRSLEAAYQALAVPYRNLGSLHEWGRTTGDWVTAMEVLIHPGREGKVQVSNALDWLGHYSWDHPRLRTPRYLVYFDKKKTMKRRVNFIQKAYKAVYDTRNAFLHGNEVGVKQFHPAWLKGMSLINVAPIIYRTALKVYLGPANMDIGEGFTEGMIRADFERFLLAAMEVEDEHPMSGRVLRKKPQTS